MSFICYNLNLPLNFTSLQINLLPNFTDCQFLTTSWFSWTGTLGFSDCLLDFHPDEKSSPSFLVLFFLKVQKKLKLFFLPFSFLAQFANPQQAKKKVPSFEKAAVDVFSMR